MAKQSSTEALKEQIRLLEIRRTNEGELLKEQFKVTYESLKPINLLKSSAKEFATSTELRETVIESSVILITGFISKKIVDTTKGGHLMKLLIALFQLGATNLVTKYSDQIQDLLMGMVDRLLKTSKEEKTE